MQTIWQRLLLIFTLRCDKSSELMSDSLDRRLHWYEQLALRGHLLSCRVCRACLRQLLFVHQASRAQSQAGASRPETASLSEEAKERIKAAIRKQK